MAAAGALTGARRWLASHAAARAAVKVTRDATLIPFAPGPAIRLARADARGAPRTEILPLVEAVLARHPTRRLRWRRAELLGATGSLTAAAEAWRELAARGDRNAEREGRAVLGRLRETDVEWLPQTPAEPGVPLVPISRRRILHVLKSAAPERQSGFTIRTMQNLRAQQAAGLEPMVVTQLGWPRAAGVRTVPASIDVEGIEHHYLDRGPDYPIDTVPADTYLQDMTDDLLPLVARLRPAVLHVHSGHRGGELVLVALAVGRALGIPVVYEVRGLFESSWSTNADVSQRTEAYARRLAQETRLLREVDGVAVISEALIDELAERGIDRGKQTLIPNGIDPAALTASARDPELRRQLGLNGRLVVGYVGNLDHPREGIDVLIRAIADLGRRGRGDIAALVVGDGSRRSELEALARQLGVTERVRFTGQVPHREIARYYGQLDLFVTPRIDERAARLITPLKPYEAMALGLPVLVSDLPALREIVAPPARGEVATPGDAPALATAIERLLDDPDRRAALAAAGSAWVRAERTWAANGPRYRALYEAILGPLD